MMKKVNVYCENTNQEKEVSIGTSLSEIAKSFNIEIEGGILGVLENNKYRELSYIVTKPSRVNFFGIENIEGERIYCRSLIFVLYKAIYDLFGKKYELSLCNSVSSGYFCTATKGKVTLTDEQVLQVKNRMKEIIDNDIPIIRYEIPTEKALALFKEQGLNSKAELFKTRGLIYSSVYKLDNVVDYYYGFLAPSTGYLKVYDLIPYKNGMILCTPDPKTNYKTVKPFVKQEKMLKNFIAYNNWNQLHKLDNIPDINNAVRSGEISDLIKVAEANQEVRMHYAAKEIHKNNKNIKIILLAGPSSSGKTTTAQRLSVHLQMFNIKSYKISLDDYFVNRDKTPLDENGDYDYETIDALDIDFFNKQLNELLEGKEIELPSYDFISGTRKFNNNKLKINKNEILIIEGIHGLNPNLTPYIDKKYIYKIYVSALTTVSIDSHNRIPSTDNRLIRRIVRDYNFRGYSAKDTISRWQKVHEGEKKYIFPYQEEADFMFNSALIYEFCVFKNNLIQILDKVPENCVEFAEAQRLLKFISYFESIDTHEIPPTSLMREFLGGSSFIY